MLSTSGGRRNYDHFRRENCCRMRVDQPPAGSAWGFGGRALRVIGESGILDVSAIAIAAALVAVAAAVAAVVGYRIGRQRAPAADSDRVDQRRVLDLLRDLGSWTQEYRGGVSRYQSQLGEIHTAVRQHAGPDTTVGGVVPLVEQIMQTNQQLQSRLEAAERQLAQQTSELETYLSEARTDALTGLANRRAFDEQLDDRWEAFRRDQTPFVLALVDLDHFKSINDSYGHQVGDRVLREIARRMHEALDQSHLVARFGGEEFAVLMPAPMTEAAAALDRFRRQNAGEPIECDGQTLKVTVSIGVAEAMGGSSLPHRLIQQADEALYAAKGIGRNRVYFHTGESPALYGAPEVAGPSENSTERGNR